MPLDVYTTLGYANVTTNWHTFGVTVSDFDDVLMPQGLVKLSTNVDRDGKEFVSSMEMAGKPVFATQVRRAGPRAGRRAGRRRTTVPFRVA